MVIDNLIKRFLTNIVFRCIFELYCTAETNSRFDIAMSEGHRREFFSDIYSNAKMAVDKMLAIVDAEKSECGNPEDRRRIFEVVRDTVGFSKLNSIVFAELRDWMIAETVKEVAYLSVNEESIECIDMNFSLADFYESQGRYDEAEPLYVDCVQRRVVALGESHLDTVASIDNLALLYSRLYNLTYDEAYHMPHMVAEDTIP